MLNKIKIGPKLIGGFLVVSLIAGIIGIIGMVNLSSISKADMNLYDKMTTPLAELITIKANFQEVSKNLLDVIRLQDAEKIKTIKENIVILRKEISDASESFEKKITTDEMKKEFELFKTARSSIGENLNTVISLAESQKDAEAYALYDGKLAQNMKEEDEIINKLTDGKINEAKITSAGNTSAANSATVLMLSIVIIGVLLSIFLGVFLARSISIPIGKIADGIHTLSKGIAIDQLELKRSDEIGTLAESMNTLATVLHKLIITDGGVILEAAANKDLSKRMTMEYEGSYLKMKNNINSLIDSLDGALCQVAEATEQVSSASQQIASGSQSLAQGTNEQASSLEEVSSSLEEMSSMTKQNAENAIQAKNLAGEANTNAGTGTESMERMSSSIHKIKESSDQTAKIVKTIDEIAMQTNLLALNAAVEAARAGEAGRGFAVVAEEVRNLAQRSAQAAKNTADMIAGSVKNADEGVQIATEVSKSFGAITTSVKKVNDLIAEIAAASQEQSQGIDQVNTAVAQMDKVTQQNAANSEESASAAEELSSQAEELQGMVAQFNLSQQTVKKVAPAPVRNIATSKPVAVQQNRKDHSSMSHNGNNKHLKPVIKKSNIAIALDQKSIEDAIPMNEEVLKEF